MTENTVTGKLQKHISVDSQYNDKGDAKHYEQGRMQAMVKFERTYGTLAVMTFCEINADKYRERLGKKPGQPLEQELLKIQWYEKAAAWYLHMIEIGCAVVVDNTKRDPLPWKESEK